MKLCGDGIALALCTIPNINHFLAQERAKRKLAIHKPLWISFLPRYFPENVRVHSQVPVYFMIFQLRSYSGDLAKSTGVLGNIYGPVLCYGRKGQTEKKGGHLPYTLHLSLSCQLSQWSCKPWSGWMIGCIIISFFFSPALQISLKWLWSIVHYKLSIRALAFALLLYWTSFT